MSKEIRVTVSDEFHRQFKAQAALGGTTITEIVVGLLKAWLKERGIEVE